MNKFILMKPDWCTASNQHLIESAHWERDANGQRERKSKWDEKSNRGRERAGIPSCLAAQIISGSEACWESGSHSHSRLWSGQGYSSQNNDWIGPCLIVSVGQGQPGAAALSKHMCSQHISACLLLLLCPHYWAGRFRRRPTAMKSKHLRAKACLCATDSVKPDWLERGKEESNGHNQDSWAFDWL